MKDEDKLIADIGEADAREEIARLQSSFDACTDIDPNADSVDSLVATKVMKWQYCDRKRAGWCDGETVWLTQSAYSPTFQGFSPSTNISHAWRVVKEIAAMNLYFVLWQDSGGWTARFYNCGDFMEEGSGATPEMAICLAAITAIAALAPASRASRLRFARIKRSILTGMKASLVAESKRESAPAAPASPEQLTGKAG